MPDNTHSSTSPTAAELAAALNADLPDVLRWSGAIARRMRKFDIGLGSKQTGSAATDALTIADLTVQELIVAALRDRNPIFKRCRILAEESTGDLTRFSLESPLTIAIDPIDGTKQYRDHTGNGYAVIVTLQDKATVHYSLVFAPEVGSEGTWVRVMNNIVSTGPDDPSKPAADVLAKLPVTQPVSSKQGKIYLIGFQQHDPARAVLVTQTGLTGVAADQCDGCLYELLARGEYAGSLIHSPNIYDFPASLNIVRAWGGDSVWVDSGEPVNFENLWMDERAKMLRLPRIVATSPHREVLTTLCKLAKDWNPVRYAD